MKIRNRLALQFALIIGLLLFSSFGAIYYLLRRYTRQEFSKQLFERSTTIAVLFLEADEANSAVIVRARRKFLQERLPHEIVGIYDINGQPIYLTHPTDTFPKRFLTRLLHLPRLTALTGYQQIAGITYHDNQGDFRILVAADDIDGEQQLAYLLQIMAGVLLLGLGLSAGLGRWFAHRFLDPVSEIMHHAQRIGASDLHLRVPVGPNEDELSELATTFNQMLGRLEIFFSHQQSFVTNASHELRTPLTIMIGEMETTLSRPRAEKFYHEILISTLTEARKLKDIITRLLQIAQLNAKQTMQHGGGKVQLDEVLYEACEEVHTIDPANTVYLSIKRLPENQDELIIPGDQPLFRLALINLLDNACKFSNRQPVQCTLSYDGRRLHIAIIDQGIGIAADELPYVQQTFYRALNAHGFHGYGIGLALAGRILRLHGADLHIESVLGQGTTMRISLPLTAGGVSPSMPPATRRSGPLKL